MYLSQSPQGNNPEATGVTQANLPESPGKMERDGPPQEPGLQREQVNAWRLRVAKFPCGPHKATFGPAGWCNLGLHANIQKALMAEKHVQKHNWRENETKCP